VSRQKLGQHFLIKGSILERIAAAVCVNADPVIEIGPGRGALTEKLLKRATRVIAIEIDPYLAAHVRERFAGNLGLEVVEGDVLAADLNQWAPAAIAGNLPYYITSPILDKVSRVNFTRAVFLIQKEVAERLVALPGSRDYGFLTVQTALFAQARLLFTVKPSAFQPPPKVDSAVVLLEPRRADLGIADTADFLRFLGLCFHHKRKTIRNNLVETYGKQLIDSWPEAPLRAEQIALEGFADMYRRLKHASTPPGAAPDTAPGRF
jgi:16S rRNA (adenine1518-N6/adenine1519-N6)-dimethyltransferase